MNEYDFLLQDRIAKIQSINDQYDLEHNAYISFSGGKDSLILSYLLDLALPDNKIPRLFINTGLEYNFIRDFVKESTYFDNRIIILNSNVNIKHMLDTFGYPFKSKEYSQKLYEFKEKGYRSKSFIKWANVDGKYGIPKKLKYQLNNEFKLKISHLCCYKLKKEPANIWAFNNKKSIKLTGMRNDEGGQRANINCVIIKKDKLKAFHPLLVVSDKWEEWFIKNYNLEICKIYNPPYNFKRTGCKGCPFNLDLQKDLDVMEQLLPAEEKQCEILWKPVYDECRRIGYRLRKYGTYKQINMFDYIESD